MGFRSGVNHEAEFVQEAVPDALGENAKILSDSRRTLRFRGDVPGSELAVESLAEEFSFRDSIDSQDPAQLRDLQRSNALSGLEGADGFLTNARAFRHVFLTETPHPSQFP